MVDAMITIFVLRLKPTVLLLDISTTKGRLMISVCGPAQPGRIPIFEASKNTFSQRRIIITSNACSDSEYLFLVPGS
jgi:hypothetical protein